VSDGHGGSSTATVTVNVAPANDAPLAVNDTASATEDTPLTLAASTLLANDSDPDAGDVLTITAVAPGTGGTPVLNPDGSVSFTPAANFNGVATFTYTVSDGHGGSSTATVTVNVAPANDAPVNTVPGAQSTAEDTPKAIAGVSVADADSASLTTTISVLHGTLSVTPGGGVSISNNGTGTVTLSGTAAQINAALAGLTYTNTPDYNGSDTLTIATSDGALTDTDTVAITVTPVADITADTVTTKEDMPISFNPVTGTNGATADSFEGASPQITAINGTAITAGGAAVTVANGTVSLSAGNVLTFTPTDDYRGTTSFTYTVTSGGVTETANVTVNVTPAVDLRARWIDYWEFNEGSGTTTLNRQPFTDQTGTITDNNKANPPNPSADLRPTWTTGRNDSAAMQFNGVGGASATRDGGWVALPSNVTDPLAAIGTTQASLSFWIKTTQVGANIGWDSPSVIGMENNGGTTDIQWGFIDSAGRIGLGMRDDAGQMSTTAINNGQWHHVVITHDFTSGATQVFVDGVRERNSTFNAGVTGIPNKFLGFGVTADDGTASHRFLNATLEDVRIYNTALTTAQAQAIYETELMGNVENVIANDGRPLHFSVSVNDAVSLVLSGLPNGTVVSDGPGGHSVTVGGAGTADISTWGATEVEISGYGTGSFMMTVTGTDASGGKSVEYMTVVTAADMFPGTAGADTLTGNANANILSGGDGNDTLSGGGGADMLYGGKGNDSLTGGAGADVFAWRTADKGTPGSAFTDTVTDFDKTNGTGDKLDLRDLLVGENAGNIDRFIVAEVSGGNTTLHISSTGAFAGNGTWTTGAQDQVIVLTGVTWTGTSQDILQQMLNGGQLVIG
jgi:hypothetical protein